MKTDYDSGIRGLKQIHKSMIIAHDDCNFDHYTRKFLERMGFLDWMEQPSKRKK